jgi:hypothetical protein
MNQDNHLLALQPVRIPRLTAIYDDPMSFREAAQIAIFVGIPFALLFAFAVTFV